MELSIIIPCFNEESIIEETVSRVQDFLKNNLKDKVSKFEIIPVNDGSSDGTKAILENLKSNEIKPHHFPVNKGRGAAMKVGIKLSNMDYLMFLDADLSYDVDHIEDVVNAFISDQSLDMIVVSPYMKNGVAKNIPFSRLVLSRTANWILSGFFSKKLSTVTSMVRAYKRSKIVHMPLLLDGKELHLEIMKKMVLKGVNILEIPGRLIWKEQKERAGRLNKKKVAGSAFKHLSYAFFSRPNRILSKLAFLLLMFSFYEFFMLSLNIMDFFVHGDSFFRSLWGAFSKTFEYTPHTVVFAFVSLFLSIQFLSFYLLYNFVKSQNEEISAHLIHLIEKINAGER